MALDIASSELGVSTPIYDPLELVNVGVSLALVAAGGLSLIYILIGGFKFILSGGDDTKTKEAMNTIRYALIGLAVTMIAFTVVSVVSRFFGFDLIGYINFDSVFKIVNSWTADPHAITLD